MWQTIIHVVFIFPAIGIAMVDRIASGAPHSGHKGQAAH